MALRGREAKRKETSKRPNVETWIRTATVRKRRGVWGSVRQDREQPSTEPIDQVPEPDQNPEQQAADESLRWPP